MEDNVICRENSIIEEIKLTAMRLEDLLKRSILRIREPILVVDTSLSVYSLIPIKYINTCAEEYLLNGSAVLLVHAEHRWI